MNQSMNQSMNQWINQSINQSINQTNKSFNFSPAKRCQLQYRHYYYQTHLMASFRLTVQSAYSSQALCTVVWSQSVCVVQCWPGTDRKWRKGRERWRQELQQQLWTSTVKRLTHCFSNCPVTSLLLTAHRHAALVMSGYNGSLQYNAVFSIARLGPWCPTTVQ